MTRKMAEYRRLRAEFLLAHPVCGCCRKFPATEIHHRNGRAGKLLLHVPLWVAVCPLCHRLIHDKPEWARARGMLCEKGQWNKMPVSDNETRTTK